MHSLEFLTTWIKIKREYFLIHTSYLSLDTVPKHGWTTTNQWIIELIVYMREHLDWYTGTIQVISKNYYREIILWQYIKKKVINNIASTIVSQLFSFSNINYNLRSGSQFHHSSAKNVWNGLETISYLGPKIWNMVPAEMKQKSFLFSFKGEIKKWIPKNCPCRIYKKYLAGVGYI